MTAILSDWALEKLQATFDFLSQHSRKYAVTVINDIFDGIQSLENQPLMAQRELWLEKSPLGYRSLVIRRRYKVVYYIDGEQIIVADIWHCQQNPTKLRRDTLKH